MTTAVHLPSGVLSFRRLVMRAFSFCTNWASSASCDEPRELWAVERIFLLSAMPDARYDATGGSSLTGVALRRCATAWRVVEVAIICRGKVDIKKKNEAAITLLSPANLNFSLDATDNLYLFFFFFNSFILILFYLFYMPRVRYDAGSTVSFSHSLFRLLFSIVTFICNGSKGPRYVLNYHSLKSIN